MRIDLYINGKNLDVYNQDLIWNWTNIRFIDGIKDAYSTDITIPKTNNNMAILEVSGLLDSVTQLYGTQITPASLGVNGVMMDVFVEMVSITSDDIKICLYQRTLPDKVFGKKLREFVHDDWETIYVWSMNTLTAYTQAFPPYNYGSTFNQFLAMRHPAKKLNDVIGDINTALQDFTLPLVDDDNLMLVAAHKKVCPQNTRQVIEFGCDLTNKELLIVGGQHITNDLEGWDGNSKVLESSTTEITFNRDCTATIHGYVSFGKKTTTGANTFMVSLLRNGVFEYGWQFNTYLNRSNGVVQSTITVQVNEGDTFSLELVCPTSPNNPQNKLEMLAGVLDIEYSDYQINDDDYGTDLTYCHRHPALNQWSPDGLIPHYFDGRTENFKIYYANGSIENISMEFPWRGFSYFGFYANIGDITLKDLYFGLCWLYEKKPIREMRRMFLVDANATATLQNAVITEIRPSSDKLGKVNAVEWAEGKGKTTLSTINSTWLADEVILHVSPFEHIQKVAGGLARISQYHIESSYNESDDKTVWNVEYHEPSGCVLMRYGSYGRLNRMGLLPPPNISSMGIEKLTQCVEVYIETFDSEIKDTDFIFLDGRKFFVVEGSTSLRNNMSTITALLIPS